MEKSLKLIFNISRILLGLVFIFSGFVKGIDPLGSAYKFNDYFTAGGLPQMDYIALGMSFLLSAAEFVIGIALITGIFMNLTAWTALCFMAFFTILTFILAIFNPVTDCGCFGDAIKLTNWETFFKNLIFSILVLFIFFRRKQFEYKTPKWTEWSALLLTIAVFFGISVYSYRHLPIIDFMPYKLGTNISEKMKIPEGAPQDEYKTVLVYKNKKSGELKDFSMENYPWQDTINWQWSSTESKLVKKGYTPPIHDFSISDKHGNNITDSILKDTGYVFLFIAYNITKSDIGSMQMAEKLYQFSVGTHKFAFYPITASINSNIDSIKNIAGLSCDFYTADETAMKTVIRSNPGIVLLKNGNIIGKYHYNDFYKIDLNKDNFVSQSIDNLRSEKETGISYALLFGLGLLLSLSWAFSLYFRKSI